MDHHLSTSAEDDLVPWLERQTLKTLGLFLPRAVRQRQIHEWQDQLDCTRATNGDLGRELVQVVRSAPSIAWTAVPSVLRVSLPPLATAMMAALVLWPAGRAPPAAGDDYAVRLWDARTHKQLGPPLTGHTAPIVSVTFNPDGRTLASTSEDGTLRLWDARTHKQLGAPLTGHTGPVVKAAFSADGRTMAAVGEDGTVLVWHMQKQLGAAHRGPARPAARVVFTPDVGTRASTDGDRIRLWDVRGRMQPGAPAWPVIDTDSLFSVAFSPDGYRLATVNDHGTVRLWDARTGKQLGAPLTDNTDPAVSVAFSPDRRMVASGTKDTTIRSWKEILWRKVAELQDRDRSR